MVLLKSALDLLQLEEDPFRLQGGLLLPPPSPFLLFSTSSSSSLFLFFGRGVVGGGAGGFTEDRAPPASASAIAGVAAAFSGTEQLHSFCCTCNVADLILLN